MIYKLTIEYDDGVLLSTAMRREEFDREARFLLAAKLYELGKLGSGKAAQLCGRSRVDFLMSLPHIGIAVSNLAAEDVDDELSFGHRH